MPGCAPAADAEPVRLVGDPVDVVTGAVSDHTRDFRLIGPLFLDWFRSYDSSQHKTACSLGWGHGHAYAWRLLFDADGISALDPVGRRTGFAALRQDGGRDRKGALALERVGLRVYRLRRPGEPVLEFTFHALAEAAGLTRVFRGAAEIVFHRGAEGQLTGITHSTGLRLDVTEDTSGRLLRIEGAWDGAEVRPVLVCEYDAAGNLARMKDAFGRTWSFGWDEANRLVRKTDRREYSFLFEYDTAGRCVRSAGEDGVLGVALRYRTEERITEVRKADGGLWQYFYDAQGAVTQVIGPYGGVRKFVRDDAGKAVGEIDPLGHSLDYIFDAAGTLIGKRFATGRVVPVRDGEEDASPPAHWHANCPLEWEYGRLLSRLRVSPEGRQAIPAELREAIPPDPVPLPDSPDVPPFGQSPWYPKPDRGRVFDIFGHLVRQEDGHGRKRRWTYDANDSMETFTDFDGGVLRQERRSWNQEASATDALGLTTHYEWSRQENLLSATDAGGTRSEYAWDQENRLRGVRRHGTVRETYHYDAAGNLIEKRDGDGRALIRYLPTVDRLFAEKHLASGEVHRFTYDTTGRYLSASVDDRTVWFAYDAWGNRILDAREGNGVEHEFDGVGQLVSTTVLGKYAIRYERAGAALTIRLPGSGWVRIDRFGERLMLRTCSNGTSELTRYDELGRCLSKIVCWSRGQRKRWIRCFHYSGEGDLQLVEDSEAGHTRYSYDAAHRLIGAEREGAPKQIFTYDDAGNLVVQPGLDGARIGASNQLIATNDEIFVYDERNRVVTRHAANDAVRYYYDSNDMLIRCELPGGQWRAEYDALGRRSATEEDGESRQYHWDTDRLAAEVGRGGQLRVYVYADNHALSPLAFLDCEDRSQDSARGRAHFIFADQRGAAVRIENDVGECAWQATTAAYGDTIVDPDTSLRFDLRFPGHIFDAATRLRYNRFRYYDSVLARFVQTDPTGIGGGMNLFAYPTNPLVVVDVRGLHGGEGGNCPKPKKAKQKEGLQEQEGTETSPTGHPVLASVEYGSNLDFLIEGAKPSTRGQLVGEHLYENPGTHDPNGGLMRYNPEKSVLPDNHVELFLASVPVDSPGKNLRYTKDDDGNIHRFEPSLDNIYHYSGSTNGKTQSGKEVPLHIPTGVRRQLQ